MDANRLVEMCARSTVDHLRKISRDRDSLARYREVSSCGADGNENTNIIDELRRMRSRLDQSSLMFSVIYHL